MDELGAKSIGKNNLKLWQEYHILKIIKKLNYTVWGSQMTIPNCRTLTKLCRAIVIVSTNAEKSWELSRQILWSEDFIKRAKNLLTLYNSIRIILVKRIEILLASLKIKNETILEHQFYMGVILRGDHNSAPLGMIEYWLTVNLIVSYYLAKQPLFAPKLAVAKIGCAETNNISYFGEAKSIYISKIVSELIWEVCIQVEIYQLISIGIQYIIKYLIIYNQKLLENWVELYLNIHEHPNFKEYFVFITRIICYLSISKYNIFYQRIKIYLRYIIIGYYCYKKMSVFMIKSADLKINKHSESLTILWENVSYRKSMDFQLNTNTPGKKVVISETNPLGKKPIFLLARGIVNILFKIIYPYPINVLRGELFKSSLAW